VTILVPRTRAIGVRLSEEEYSVLEKFCVENGVRSISDLARAAISNFVNRANQENALASAVSENVAQVKEMEVKIKRLSAEIALLKVASPASTAQNDDKWQSGER
jgi:hypothetical protein